MPEVITPFEIANLTTKPELSTRPRVSDDIQQTLATILAWDGTKRRILMAALGGSLHVTTPQLKTIVSRTKTGASELITFGDIPTTEVMVMGHPDNNALIWVTVGTTQSTSNSWPLSAKEIFSFSVDNMQHVLIGCVTVGEKAIIAYTR